MNKSRDARNVRDLQADGWDVCIVWECETLDPEPMRRRLVHFLDDELS